MATLTIADLDNGKRDLETVDAVANSSSDFTTTRYGDRVLTRAGALRRLGWQAPVPYAPGLNVDSPVFTVEYGTAPNVVVYRPDPALVPFTTAAWNPDQWRVAQNTNDTNLVYQFPTLGTAESAAAILPEGSAVVVDGQSQGQVVGGGYSPISRPAPDRVTDYAELLAYQGKNSVVQVVGLLVTNKPSGISGNFIRTNRPGAVTDGGTVFVLTNGDVFEREYKGAVHMKWFGAVLDGETHDHVAAQKAIDACRTAGWSPLVVDGEARIGASLIVDRAVDQNSSEWRVIGNGANAGFLVDSGVTLFDSTLPMTTRDPVAEFVTLKQLNIRQSAYWDDCYVFSKKFIRIKSIDCFFWLIRFQGSDSSYAQTLHFIGCNIRNNRPSFIDTRGSYDIVFNTCIIENGGTVVRSVDTEVGTSGLRFIGCVIEGLQSSTVIATGVAGFSLVGCHLESNVANDFNFWAGTLANKSITVTGNYVYNPNGITVLHGGGASVTSVGNTIVGNYLHEGATRCDSFESIGDSGPITADPVTAGIGSGFKCYGPGVDSAIGDAPGPSVRLRVRARAENARVIDALTPTGLDVFVAYTNGQVAVPRISSAANDSAAAAAGVPLGGLYHDGGSLRVRIS